MKKNPFWKYFLRFSFCLVMVFILLCDGTPAFCVIAAPLSVDLQPGSDSGIYDNDDLTNIPTPTIDIIAAVEGNTINIYKDSVLLGQAILVSGTLYEYTFTETQLTEGSNIITARSDDGGEESDDSPSLEIVLDTSGPQIVERNPRSPINIQSTVLDSLTVTFSEAIDYDSVGGDFTLDDVDIIGPQDTITPSDITWLGNDKYEISFDSQTELGVYAVFIGPLITDLAGNEMDQDGDGQPGESYEDVFIFSFVVDAGERIFWEGFEDPHPDWEIDNGVWEFGEPTYSLDSAHSVTSVAGTNLSGNYPVNTDSRLISPVITLPGVASDELLLLRFWQWFSYSVPDYGQVQISTWDGTVWSDWETLATPAPNNTIACTT